MNRRLFLLQQLGTGAGLLAPAFLQAQTMHGQHGSGHAMGAQPPAPSTMAQTLPIQQPLQPLWKLPNQSTLPGKFIARLEATPATVELIPGIATQVWCYSGKLPGPLIEVYEGDTVEITFVNKLTQPTTVHWHGLPVPADQDGGPMQLVAPGQTRIYRFTLPVGSAGTYWFHPHPHNMTAEQVFRGLAGTFIVRAKQDPLADFEEQHLLFSDLKLDRAGQIAPNDMMDWMNGREGQFVLVNGQLRPTITVHAPQRWRLWNACNARYLQIAGVPMQLVGTDGGLLEKPRNINTLLLAPGERAEIIVTPAAGMTQVTLKSVAYDRGKMGMGNRGRKQDRDTVLADVDLMGHGTVRVPAQLRSIVPFGEASVTRQVVFTEAMDMSSMHALDKNGRPQGMQFLINGRVFDHRRIDFHGKRGDVELWEVMNASDMDHPFHLHGTQFQVVNRQQGKQVTTESFIALRDTVNVRPGEAVRIKVVMPHAGDWMFHCHILEHEDLGMMGILRVT